MGDSENNDTSESSKQQSNRRGGKRTARACDECRMRKAKCDGLSPCESCRNADRHCTYNLSAGRSTGSSTRIRILEDRLRRARAYLQEAQKRTPSLRDVNFDALLEPTEPDDASMADSMPSKPESDDKSHQLESMMDAYGRFGMDTSNRMERDFYGAGSGLAWIHRANRYLSDYHAGQTAEVPPEQNDSATIQLFDAPLPKQSSLSDEESAHQLLPAREIANSMLHIIFTQVYPLFHFLDEDYFNDSMDQIYAKHPYNYADSDQHFLTLFHFVIALGYLFSRAEHDKLGCRNAISQAMHHFVVGRSMLDIAHLRTLRSLQAVVCIVLFLISTARVASGHAFLGVACAAALRQGLHHRSTHEISLPAKERKVRRRVFWAVMNLDMYVSGVLGLPSFIDLNAADPAIDLTIGAAFKSLKSGRGLANVEELGLIASAKHIELMRIMSKARQTLFPKPLDPPDSEIQRGTISVSSAKLEEIENRFRHWASSLREILAFEPQDEGSISIKYELQIAYYFSQLVLYRTFLHYLSPKHNNVETTPRQMSYAQTCLRMASKTIGLSVDHQKLGLLCPASWPALYAVFTSIVCLIFSLALDPKGRESAKTRHEVELGIRLLACTACTTDTGSVRCLEILRRLIGKIQNKVAIDVDAITSSTRPCCRMQLDSARSTSLEPRERVFDRTQTDSTNSQSYAGSYLSEVPSDVSGPSHGNSTVSTFNQASSALSSDGHNLFQPQNWYAQYPEEMLDMFYANQFTWPGLEHTNDTELTRSSTAQRQHSNRNRSPSTSAEPGLSAEEIAHFMHINPGDNPFPFQSDT